MKKKAYDLGVIGLLVLIAVTTLNAAIPRLKNAENGTAQSFLNPTETNGTTTKSQANTSYITASIPVGSQPHAVEVNTVTNKIYVANEGSFPDLGTVTVIDGRDNSTETIEVGRQPRSLAVNSVTNRIYVANVSSFDVTVIDGIDNSTTTIPVGRFPYHVAINSVTNKVYVVNNGSNTVTIIDGDTGFTTTVPTGLTPAFVAINSATNKIYVTSLFSTYHFVTIIDGNNNNSTKLINAGSSQNSIAINPETGLVYVALIPLSQILVIDGNSDTVLARVATGTQPVDIAINQRTNKIYVACTGSTPNLTIIDGENNSAITAVSGTKFVSVDVDPEMNRIFAAFFTNTEGGVIVLDGTDLSTTPVAISTFPSEVAVNPITSNAYVTVRTANLVTEISPELVSVSGRIMTPNHQPIRNATVALTDRVGLRRIAVTGSFGIYRFDDVPIGEPYTIGVLSKRFRFASWQVSVTGTIRHLDFVGLE